jgi:hypothetical protein
MLPGRLGPESLLSLAVIGTIKEEVLPLDELAPRLPALVQAWGFSAHAFGGRPLPPEGSPWHDWLQALCRARGFLLPGNQVDERRAILFLLKALRDGRWGPRTLERPEGMPLSVGAGEDIQACRASAREGGFWLGDLRARQLAHRPVAEQQRQRGAVAWLLGAVHGVRGCGPPPPTRDWRGARRDAGPRPASPPRQGPIARAIVRHRAAAADPHHMVCGERRSTLPVS